jgi:hypothetical protein
MSDPRVLPVSTHVSSSTFGAVLRFGEREKLGLGDALERLIGEGLMRVGLSNQIPNAQDGPEATKTEGGIEEAIEASPRLLAVLERGEVRSMDDLLGRILAGTLQEIDGVGPGTERSIIEGLVQAGYMTVGVQE